MEVNAEFPLLNERLVQVPALHMGMRCFRLIGGLVEAKRKGLIRDIGPLLAVLRDAAFFGISEARFQRLLQDAGECLKRALGQGTALQSRLTKNQSPEVFSGPSSVPEDQKHSHQHTFVAAWFYPEQRRRGTCKS